MVWLSFQSVVDGFEFHHWRNGDLNRSLVFGYYKDERTWESVSGVAEPWERETFFDPEGLKFALEFAEDASEKDNLRRIWEQAELRPGQTEPSLSAGGCAHKVAAFYGFPGWGR